MDKITQKIILASNSPRRRELLLKICKDFEVVPADIPEEADLSLSPEEALLNIAMSKAFAVWRKHKDAVVIGADTDVIFGGEILGKPENANAAEKMLRRLSGRRHRVVTSVCVIKGGRYTCGYCVSYVTFNRLTDVLIKNYIESGLCMDKAGSYGIQDGYPLVKYYRGSYTNIVGLPVRLTAKLLKESLYGNQNLR